ncbi:hypothetical protein OG897_35685 [Streptomyces sp. NBC_00237]|uniref:hypothetical protein n=1 Tax=Streptomyces sp. NBC_00237 TaxID=2975687 RepID=UPI0022536CA0|nr:hypothetical protein [Streptomyces sp. NBC_00237]MCX5206734.1 hypothetical protein [Streptomyces sp. NBC_00237]
MSDANQRTLRTGLQTLLGVAAALPLIIDASGIPQSTAGVAVAVAVAAGITRVMALPVVHQLLPEWLYRSESAPEPSVRHAEPAEPADITTLQG